MTAFVADTPIELTSVPRCSPIAEPIEECERQFKQILGCYSFDEVAELREAIPAALNTINLFNIRNYLIQKYSIVNLI